METSEKIVVAHIKQPHVESLETFVLARMMNPFCFRPVPVLTHDLTKCHDFKGEIQYYALNELHPLRRKIELALDYRFHFLPFYYQTLRKLRPDLIHAHFSGAGLSVLRAATRLKIPLLINFYGIETNYHLSDPQWYSFYRKLAGSHAMFACSSDTMKESMEAFGFKPSNIEVVRCGIDTRLFEGKTLEYQPSQRLEMLCVGRLHEEKGINYLLEACQLLLKKGFLSWQLTIIGDGPLNGELQAYTKTLGIDDRVQFAGKKSSHEVRIALQASHLFVLPSLQETQGVVFQEAQATRTPVIGTNIGGIPEGVEDGVTGFLVEPANPGQIAEKILFMAERPLLFKQMGEAGRMLVLKKFSRENEYRQLANLYRKTITGFNPQK